MLYDFVNGQTSVVLRVKLRDSSVSTGAGLTGLTSASTGLIISTIADNEVAATVYTVAGSTIETIATLGTYASPTATKCRFKEVDATNHPGLYEVQIANARFAVASAKSLILSFSGATNLIQCDVVIPLRVVDPYGASFGNVSLVATGLDAITTTEPSISGDGAMSTWNFRKLLRWAVSGMSNGTRSLSGGAGTLVVKKLAGTTASTQTIADDGAGNETLGVPS